MKRLAIAGLALWLSAAAWAQTGKITGVVSDAITGEALIQASVLVNGTGVATDFDGAYTLDLPYGAYDITVQYIGYESQTRSVTVDRALVQANFKLSTIVLQEAEVIADVAIERETPVAFSNIKPVQIQEELGSQPIPMILNSTPGVYATQAGSDDNGPSISIRGFKQRNVSVLVDGIPVNDMESGAVFWNNWFGLDLVTQTMQVQRGLGASKLALPAIGGTVNIVTSGIESSRKTSVKQEVGSFGFTRTSLGHTSGRLDGGWGYTLAGSFQNRQGYFQQDYNRAFFYYVKIQKALGNHTLSISATGSPSENASRGYQQRIATHNKDFARSLFTGSEADYERLRGYSVAYDAIFNDGTLLQQEELAAYDSLNALYGYSSADDFEEEVSATDFIDTTGLVSYGDNYNVHWGMLNNEVLYERQNKYHKPLFSLRHSWRVSDKLYISNMAYASYGYGGG
ncbi:MAG: TonB-dependent receptor, partial [Bacteroidota bacterium]|nr:TonB-dependent receptor [Bacteroidota bacterium]